MLVRYTGFRRKNKTDFIEFYYNTPRYIDAFGTYEEFRRLPFDARWGVYISFLDSVGYYIEVNRFKQRNSIKFYWRFFANGVYSKYKFKDRWQCQRHALGLVLKERNIQDGVEEIPGGFSQQRWENNNPE